MYQNTGGVAVDWINDKVYFSFGDVGSELVTPNHLAIYDITTGEYSEIMTSSPAVYDDIAVDPVAQ